MELPSSKVSASNEAINKSTALTGLSTLFVRDDVSILRFFSCLRVHEDNPFFVLVRIPNPFYLDSLRSRQILPYLCSLSLFLSLSLLFFSPCHLEYRPLAARPLFEQPVSKNKLRGNARRSVLDHANSSKLTASIRDINSRHLETNRYAIVKRRDVFALITS